ncbi:hypothetical protein ACFL1E_06880 [Candidatus Omnitrophota bacterium]
MAKDSKAAPKGNILKAFISGLSPKEKKLLYITVGIVALLLFDKLVFGPILGESHLLEDRISSQSQLIKKNLMILQYKDKIMKDEEAHSIFYAQKESTQEQLIGAFLSEVEKMAKEASVALTNINPVNAAEKKGYVEFTLTVECSGKMEHMTDFIYTMENSKKPIRVVSYEISPKNRNEYEAKCILTVAKIIVMPDGSIAAIKEAESTGETEEEAE